MADIAANERQDMISSSEPDTAVTQRKNKSKKKIIRICVIAFVLLTLIVTQTVTHILLNDNFSRGEYNKYTTNYRYDHYEKDYPRKNVSFKSGENLLQGYIYGNDNDKGLLVFAHGIGGGHEWYLSFITYMVDKGWRVFAYDATGSCTSEGNGTKGLPQSALDLDNALTYIESDSELSKLPVFLAGHSWGGYAVTAVLNFDHDIKASASISGYAYPIDMIMETADGMMGKVSYLLYPFIWTDCFARFGSKVNMSAVDGINSSDVPVMIIHGKKDTVIGYDRSSIISKKGEIVNKNVEYYSIDDKYSGHNSIFRSEKANEYLEKLNKEYDKMAEKYKDGKVPDDERKKFFDDVDRELANQPNEKLFDDINSFFESHL